MRAFTAFFFSGVAGLLYQTVWQRLLGIFSGADVQSATLVVAAFMTGLGAGSLAGGVVADRVSARTSIALFALAELAIGVFGLFSGSLFYGVLYERVGRLGLGIAPTTALLFIALLWPTFFMGMSLPLLARGLTQTVGRAASTIGRLYGVNTLGAALGALGATWWSLPQAGLSGSLTVAAALNGFCALVALSLLLAPRRRLDRPASPAPNASDTTAPEPSAPRISERSLPLSAWIALFALSGFVALSLEIVWFRLLAVMVKSTAFTFGTLLGIYLIGIGAGAAAGGAVARRVRRPAFMFLVLQTAIAVYAAMSVSLLVGRLETSPSLQPYAEYFGAYDALDIRTVLVEIQGEIAGGHLRDLASGLSWQFAGLYLLLPSLLVLPPTVMSGISFALLQRIIHTELRHVGRRVGALLTANIAGSTLGAFITGWLLLDWLGTPGTLQLLVAASGLFGVLAVRHRLTASRVVQGAAYVAVLMAIAAVAVLVPGKRTLWARLHGAPPDRIIVGEDRTGLSVLRSDRANYRRVVVFVNGRGQSWVPYGGIHTVLGALPAFIHPHPRTAALIGLGSGDSLFAMAGRAELERIYSIEIIKPQLDTLQRLAGFQGYPGLSDAIRDPRIEHVTGDGRLYLRKEQRKYDIIEADALYPTSAYSGNLYSDEYFQLLKSHLNPGGLAVSWIPTDRAGRTFLKVFPYVWEHPPFMVGSNDPIRIDRAALAARLDDRRVLDYYTLAGVNIRELLEPFLALEGKMYDPGFDRASLLDVNTDLFPRDEFDIPPLFGR